MIIYLNYRIIDRATQQFVDRKLVPPGKFSQNYTPLRNFFPADMYLNERISREKEVSNFGGHP